MIAVTRNLHPARVFGRLRVSLLLVALFAVALVSVPRTGAAGDWAGFRGPQGDGVTADSGPVEWDSETNVLWRVPLPRPGNGSPIVSNGRVFVTSTEDEDGKLRSLYCFDRKTGEQLWKQTVEFGKKMPTHDTNPYSGSTPAANGSRVVVWHASAGLYCYDFDGQLLWHQDLGEFEHMWGYGTSPVLHEDKVLIHTGPGKQTWLAAYSLEDGQPLWKTEEPQDGNGERNSAGKYMGSWSTPVLTTVDGDVQAVCTMPTRLVGYDVRSGKIVWWCDGIRGDRGDLAYSSPLIQGDLCVAIGGFRGPSIGVQLGGQGNVTESHRLWRSDQNPQSIGSGVFVGEHVYVPDAGPGSIRCIKAATGEVVWQKRLGGSPFWSSIVSAAGLNYVTDRDGTTYVFRATPEDLEVVAKNQLRETCNATPAISDGQAFIRTWKHLYCIGKP